MFLTGAAERPQIMEIRNSKAKLSCITIVEGRSFAVDMLSAAYGLGSWIAMTGLWVELPLLVQRLPEGWTLAANLALALQIANIGPVVYCLLNRLFPRVVEERSGTHAQLLIGSVSTFLLIFTWSSTVQIGFSKISLSLYILSFGLSIVDCASSVVFLPYMARFRSIYLVPYLVGEGLGGLFPSLVASGQGIGEASCVNSTIPYGSSNWTTNVTILVPRIGDPRFEPEWFFAFLFFMIVLSWMAFILLDNLSVCRREMVTEKPPKRQATDNLLRLDDVRSVNYDDIGRVNEKLMYSGSSRQEKSVIVDRDVGNEYKKTTFVYLLTAQGWASVATFGVFPAIQTYSCLPYGYHAFHYTVTLCSAAYPAACFIAMFYAIKDIKKIATLSFIATMLSIFIMYTAIASPHPPLVNCKAGGPLIVLCWVLFVSLFSYVKTVATIWLSEHWKHQGLYWCGIVTQLGAAFGAFLMFLLVNIFELFEDDKQC